MTVQSDLSKVQHDGNGVAVTFDFQFRIFDESELIVIVTDAAGTDTTLTLGTDYTIAGVGEDQGAVTLTGAPLPTGSKITIMRVLDVVQKTALENQGGYYPDVVEAALDRLAMICQQLQEILDRTLKGSASDDVDMTLPTAAVRASRFLAFDATGKPVAVAGGDQSGQTVTAQNTSDTRTLAAWMAALLAEIATRAADDATLQGLINALGEDLNALDQEVTGGVGKLLKATTEQMQVGDNDSVIASAAGVHQAIEARVFAPFLHVQDQKPSGTHGGTATAGAWRTRDLNTVLHNGISGASLASNRITLPAGTYYCEASAPGHGAGTHIARLENVTGGATLAQGTTERSAVGGQYATSRSLIAGRFTLSSDATVELQHRGTENASTTGFGVAANIGVPEIYSELLIWKIA